MDPVAPGARMAEAVEVVRAKRRPCDCWARDRVHPGRVHFAIKAAGEPSRWNKLRALRVLAWWDARSSAGDPEHPTTERCPFADGNVVTVVRPPALPRDGPARSATLQVE